jgi:probable rRNA maturation factor
LRIGLRNKKLVKENIDTGKIRKLIKRLIGIENKKLGEIQIIFLNNQEILKINKEFLKHDYFTDVITFCYNKKNIVCGDICISIDSVKKNAKNYRTELNRELIRVIVHGVLHLIGYEDTDAKSKEIMKKKENKYLAMYVH